MQCYSCSHGSAEPVLFLGFALEVMVSSWPPHTYMSLYFALTCSSSLWVFPFPLQLVPLPHFVLHYIFLLHKHLKYSYSFLLFSFRVSPPNPPSRMFRVLAFPCFVLLPGLCLHLSSQVETVCHPGSKTQSQQATCPYSITPDVFLIRFPRKLSTSPLLLQSWKPHSSSHIPPELSAQEELLASVRTGTSNLLSLKSTNSSLASTI